MKTLSLTITVIMVATLAVTAGSVTAQITSNGPYYATPSWDQQLPASTRFVVLSNWVDAAHPSGGTAVLDRETGLVWEQSPLAPCVNPLFCRTFDNGVRSWFDAQEYCNSLTVGNRKGWRLPTVQELVSLVDPTQSSDPSLPAGHPFSAAQFNPPIAVLNFWSATTSAKDPSTAWFVNFLAPGGVGVGIPKVTPLFVWCVRGGHGVDAQ